MAKFWENLKYHEDEFEKHPITREEINFLTMLQEEMNTQDFIGQADPRFWVIRDYDRIFGENLTNPDGVIVYIAKEPAFTYDYFGDKKFRDVVYDYFMQKCPDAAPHMDLSNVYNADSFLNEFKDTIIGGIDFIEYQIIPRYSGMFLTQKAAEEHLRANYYHYSKDATTYAMTAWRSKEADMLYERNIALRRF
jgi:hypothetical protein